MLVFYILLLFLGALSVNSRLLSPTISFTISGQKVELLIDINGKESYLVKTGTPKRTNDVGYNVTEDFVDLKQQFVYLVNNNINDHNVLATGRYGQASLDQYNGPVPVTFGLIDKSDREPTTAFSNEQVRQGRLGMNSLNVDTKTNVTKAWLRKDKAIFAWLGGCDEDGRKCFTSWQLYKCHGPKDIDDTKATIIPAIINNKNQWQSAFQGYKMGKKFVSDKPFTAIYSTTTPDIHVPEDIFKYLVDMLMAKKTPEGYEYICNFQSFAQDIVISTKVGTLTLPGEVYTHYYKDNCYLRMRPSNGDYWVFGLQWYKAYATCFDPETKTVQFNKPIDKTKTGEMREIEEEDRRVKVYEY